MKRRDLIVITSCIAVMFSVIILSASVVSKVVGKKHVTERTVYPAQWASNYVEDEQAYEELLEMRSVDWETFEASPDQIITMNTDSYSTSFTTITNVPNTSHMDDYDRRLALMQEVEAWEFITNDKITAEGSHQSFSSYSSILQELRNENTETVTVDVWYWANPQDETDMTKITKQKTFAINSKVAPTFKHIFEDIYNDESKPVLNLGDTAMGTWVLRGKNSGNGPSAHSIGVCIDINPGTGSFQINGKWYGNGYGQNVMSKEMWEQLPEVHNKYHVLYDGCPIVEVFKAYGWYWGGDWKKVKDCMHIAYLADGSNARAIGIQNYLERSK